MQGNETFITNIFSDSYLPSVNGKKFEEIAYSTYFDIEILNQLSKEFTFYIFIGTDSGMMLNHLKQLNIDPSSIYLFIEASEIKSQFNKDLFGLKQPNIAITTIDNWQDEAEKSDIIKYIEVDRVQVIKSFSAQDQTYPAYASIAQKLHDDINQLKWNHPDKFQKKIYIQRQIENCADNINPAIQLKGLLKDKPALILAGGPSLDNYIDWIEEHQQNYIVIAVSRVARRLLSTKIVPDIFVTADPFESAYTTSKEVLSFSEKSILVHQSYGHPKLIGQWQGQQFYLGDLLPWDSDYKPENITAIGPTVTNGAIHLALQMGIINQILFGVDLCYSSDGYSHVSQTIERDQGADLGFAGTLVTTNNGEQANTTYEMLEARTSISILAELAEKQGGQIISPSSSSAAIKDVSYLPLSTIKIPSEKIHSFVGALFNTRAFAEHNPHHHSKLLEEYKKLEKEVKQILNLSQEIVDICSLHYETQDKATNSEYLNKIFVIENKLKKHSKIISIVESFGVNGYYDFIHPDIIQAQDNELDIIDRYYNSLYFACDVFLDLINNTIQQIQLHLTKNSNKNDTKSNFDDIIKSDITEQLTVTIRLENLEKKLYNYFQNNNKDKLLQTIQQISSFNSEESTSLSHLAQGYLLELDGETGHAINEYLNANHEKTLESGLKRILDLTLKNGDIENTIAVLHALSDISSDYLIQLASLYQISEQYKDALDTYSLYVDKNPDDILVLIKMGSLYLSLDILDGAEFVFNRVIEIDPNNQSALAYLKLISTKLNNPTYKYNELTIEKNDFIEINEYDYYKSLNNFNLDFERLRKAEKTGIIGFIATSQNIRNSLFINHVNELYQNFSNISFVIFYFNKEIKFKVKNIFHNLKTRVVYKKPKNINELLENIEIYISFSEDINGSLLKSNIDNLTTQLLQRYSNKIFLHYFNSQHINESINEASSRIKNDNYWGKILEVCLKLGINISHLKNEKHQYVKALLTEGINYKSNNKLKFSYHGQNKSSLKTIELAINHKNLIHFFHDFRNAEKN